VGAEVPAARRSVEEAARGTEVPASAAAAATGAMGAPSKPSRKRKLGFSGLR
jgi:hypothetical protein